MRRAASQNGSGRVTFGRDEAGAAAVELAIVAPIVFLLLFGVAEFGIAAFRWNTVTEAARVGARFAMVRGAESGRTAIPADVRTFVRSTMADQDLRVETSWPSGSKAPGQTVRVVVDYQVPLRISGLFPSMTISSTAQSVIVY